MSTTLGIINWQKGAGDWLDTFNADMTRLAAGVDSLSSGNISTGSITVNKLKASNSPSAGYKITIDPTTGDFYYKNNDVIFSELPGYANFTQSEIVRVKADLSGFEPAPSASIDFDKIDYTGTIPTSGYKIVAHNTTKPELVNQVPVANLPITGAPATGWVVKAQVSSGTVMNLYYDVTANSLESNKLRYSETDTAVYGNEFISVYLPEYSNIGKIHDTTGSAVEYTESSFYGKAQESSGASFQYPSDMGFAYKIQDTAGTAVKYTSANFFGKAQESSGGSFFYPPDMSFVGKVRHSVGASLQYMTDYRTSYGIPTVTGTDFSNIAQNGAITAGGTSLIAVYDLSMTNFADVSGTNKFITTHGNVTLSATQKYSGGYSIYFDGTNDWLSIPQHADFNFGNGDFEINMWLYLTSDNYSTFGRIFCTRDGDVIPGIQIAHTSALTITVSFSSNGASSDIGSRAFPYSLNTWFNIKITRVGTALSVYKDSVLQGTAITTSAVIYYNIGDTVVIGGQTGTNRAITGYVDDFTIKKTGITVLDILTDYAYTSLLAGTDYLVYRLNGTSIFNVRRLRASTATMRVETL